MKEKKVMLKKQLIKEVAKETGLYQQDVKKMLHALIRVVGRTLKRGDEIVILKFGKFYPMATKERIIDNEYTHGRKVIPAGTTYKFKFGEYFINQLKDKEKE